MNTNTVSPATAAKLAAAGFPQPEPAPGQWWGDESGLVFISEKTASYFTVVRYVPGTRPLVDEYFDVEDFNGLVFLPTVGDIFLELKYVLDPILLLEGDSWNICFMNLHGNLESLIQMPHKHPAEAAALAWLEINKG